MDANVKRAAAEFAVGFVESGMVVGLGVGSTAIFATRRIAQLLQRGELRDVLGVPCSLQTEHDAQVLGIPLTTLDDHPMVDLTIDGADEVDPHLNLIKGGGGALLREKIVAQATKRQIIVADASKLSPALGTHWPVPIEVIRFNWRAQMRWLETLGACVVARKRKNGELFLTDQGNLILDANFGAIAEPATLARTLSDHAGIVEYGLFIRLTHDLVIADVNGVRHVDGRITMEKLRRKHNGSY